MKTEFDEINAVFVIEDEIKFTGVVIETEEKPGASELLSKVSFIHCLHLVLAERKV